MGLLLPLTFNDPVFFSGDSVYLWGEPVPVFLEHSPLTSRKPLIKWADQGLMVCGSPAFSKEDYQQHLLAFFRQEAHPHMADMLHIWEKNMGIQHKNLKLSHARSRWGSCSSQGNININWQLMRLPRAVVEYVIIHELAHIVHMNHSRHFWQLVHTHCPDYKVHRKTLEQASLKWGYAFWQVGDNP